MRLFERLRKKLGFEPVEIKADPDLRKGTLAGATLDLASTDGMCCGHCSGNTEGHVAEQQRA